jgi:hypothetical protein
VYFYREEKSLNVQGIAIRVSVKGIADSGEAEKLVYAVIV